MWETNFGWLPPVHTLMGDQIGSNQLARAFWVFIIAIWMGELPHYGFDFTFPWWLIVLSIFLCAFWTSLYLILRNIYSRHLLISHCAICFINRVVRVFYIFFQTLLIYSKNMYGKLCAWCWRQNDKTFFAP